VPSTYIISFLQSLYISNKVPYRGPFRFEIPKASRPRAVKNLECSLYGIFACLKNRSIFEDTKFLNEKEREIRTSGSPSYFLGWTVTSRSQKAPPDWQVSCSRESCGWGACTRYRGKNGPGFPSPEKVMGFEEMQQCELPITAGVLRHYHFTTCVDQHPHWSPVRWVEPLITEHVLIIEHFSISFHFLINLSNFCAIGHWTHKPKGYKHSLNVTSKEASQPKKNKRG